MRASICSPAFSPALAFNGPKFYRRANF
uniref:Uncharacterized protein n=1 Tax=Arundo donax TaxID=35708 RepID=A0A0A8ZSP7_ARUDO